MPAIPQPAATVILLRDTTDLPEVLMIERHSKSDFLPDLYVFPGGRVEQNDLALADRLVGIDAAAAADALGGVEPDRALGFFAAAIRETFEECGILLARPSGTAELITAERAASLAKHRLDVQGGATSFRDLIEAEKLDLAADRLAAHAHWITPEAVPKRFDTYFFTAVAPERQVAHHDGVETTDHIWIRPADALDQMRRLERRIIFPTACNLEVLQGLATAEQIFEASRTRPVVPVVPEIRDTTEGKQIVIRGDADYPTTSQRLPSRGSA